MLKNSPGHIHFSLYRLLLFCQDIPDLGHKYSQQFIAADRVIFINEFPEAPWYGIIVGRELEMRRS